VEAQDDWDAAIDRRVLILSCPILGDFMTLYNLAGQSFHRRFLGVMLWMVSWFQAICRSSMADAEWATLFKTVKFELKVAVTLVVLLKGHLCLFLNVRISPSFIGSVPEFFCIFLISLLHFSCFILEATHRPHGHTPSISWGIGPLSHVLVCPLSHILLCY